ncbi:MAG: DNA alkylation response protein, partial [Myxococcota bacterium]|nr:DNA alkylation response protein [Myxococcota bacterium]
MKHHAPNTTLPTHEVVNQATEFTDVNLYHTDVALKEAIARVGAPWLEERCEALGERAGSQQMQEWGRVANENPPVFKPFDRFGHRIDYVEFHPAYHNLMGEAMKAGLSSAAWNEEQAGHVGFAALSYLFGQAEAGVLCPMTMSYAAVPSLRIQPDVGQQWIDKLLVPEYDGRFLPIEQKKSATFGMAMTEKQGGSDVRANSTRATPIGEAGPGKEYELVGHKWFCSAPMSDG